MDRMERLLDVMQSGDDAVSAVAVAAYTGDINEGAAAVMYASRQRLVRTLAALAARGDVNPNATDANGRTPLMVVVQQQDVGPVKALLDVFPLVDCNFVSMRDGVTALHLAAFCSSSAVVQLLLGLGADPSIVDFRGKTPAAWATDANMAVIAAHPRRLRE